MPNILFFGLTASLIVLAEHSLTGNGSSVGLPVAPFEIAGAALGLLLVLRTNAGYARWWEARKLWGGNVNQSRNLAISGLSYGPSDFVWRHEFAQWATAFPHVKLRGLRREKEQPQARRLLGDSVANTLEAAVHPASLVSAHLAGLLRAAHKKWLATQTAQEGDNPPDPNRLLPPVVSEMLGPPISSATGQTP